MSFPSNELGNICSCEATLIDVGIIPLLKACLWGLVNLTTGNTLLSNISANT